jgi:hypothetical protein
VRSGVLPIPAGANQAHTRYFKIEFPAPFKAPPTITPSVLTKGSGRTFGLAAYDLTNRDINGEVVEARYLQAPQAAVDVQIVAAGQWK